MEDINEYSDIDDRKLVRPNSSFDRRGLLLRGPHALSNNNATSDQRSPVATNTPRKNLRTLMKGTKNNQSARSLNRSNSDQQPQKSKSLRNLFSHSSPKNSFGDVEIPHNKNGLQTYLSQTNSMSFELKSPPQRDLSKSVKELDTSPKSRPSSKLSNSNGQQRMSPSDTSNGGYSPPQQMPRMGACVGQKDTAKRMVKNTDVDQLCGMGMMFM